MALYTEDELKEYAKKALPADDFSAAARGGRVPSMCSESFDIEKKVSLARS